MSRDDETSAPEADAATGERALRAAMDRLARRSWSRRSLIDALVRTGIDPDDAATAVATCVDRGWLDEDAAARTRATSIVGRGGADAAFVAARLEAHGVDPDVARTVAADAVPDPLEAAAAEIAAARPRQRTPDARDRRRLAGRLARRGFDEDVIRTAMNQAGLPIEELE